MFTILTSIITGIFTMLIELFGLVFSSFKKDHTYHADFGTESSLLSRWNVGFRLTGRKSITAKNSYVNSLVIGGTGSGKTSVSILTSLYAMQGSFVVHDPSGELYAKSAAHLESRGYVIKTLNFTKPEESCGYNPLKRANTPSEIQKVASLLVSNALGTNSKDPFWNTQATALLAVVIAILKTQAEDYQHLYMVRQLLNQLGTPAPNEKTKNPVDALFARYADHALFAEYQSIISYDPKLLTSIVATCKSALNIFADEAVAKVTATDTLDMDSFRTQKTALFIQNQIADQKYYAVITSLFFEQFFSSVLARFPEKSEYDLFFLIDECASLKLPTLPLAVANIRKHRAGAMLVIQDVNQLVHAYGKPDAEAIRANCFSKIYFTGASLETAKELEQTLGKYEYTDRKNQKNIRPLMTADEIRTMPTNRALLVCGHHRPIYARLRPCYKSFRYKRYMTLPAPDKHGDAATTLSVLPL